LEVAAGINASQIKFKLNGTDKVSVNEKGELSFGTVLGEKQMVGLKAFQTIHGKEVPVPASFEVNDSNIVSFKLGKYDASKKLVIDPLIYGSYYGGDNGPDSVQAVSSDVDGGVYLTGKTRASQFPAIFGPYGFNLSGGFDAFVTKLQGDAYSHDYAALMGGSNDDEGTRIGVDPFGNVWVAGITASFNFPGNNRNNIQLLRLTSAVAPTGGTFTITAGGQTTAPIAFNATPAQVQAALEALFGAGNVSVTLKLGTGSLDNGATYRVEINKNVFLGILTINNDGMAPRYQSLRATNNFAQLIRSQGGVDPTGGAYRLSINGQTTDPIAFNANLQTVFNRLNALPSLNGNIQLVSASVPANNGSLPAVVYFNLPDPIDTLTVDNTLLTGGVLEVVQADTWFIGWDNSSSIPTGGTFALDANGVNNNFAFNASAAQIGNGLNASLGAGNVLTAGIGGANLPNAVIRTTFVGALADQAIPVSVDSSQLQPRPTYGVSRGTTDIFLTRFAKDGLLLNPLPTQTLMFGGDGEDTLTGFAIRPKDSPTASDPVEFLFAGNNEFNVENIPTTWNGNQSYYARVQYLNGVFTTLPGSSGYFTDSLFATVNGGALDAEGNMYLGGTVNNTGTTDTAINPIWITTPGGFEGSRLLRNSDMFLRKYNNAGAMQYSVLLGGNNQEAGGGFAFDMTNGPGFITGSAVAIDPQGNAYITGLTNSFNYPRTRGVFGEVFSNNATSVVSKVNSDGSQLVYSTNLRTNHASSLIPAGIAVDQAGNAHISGNILPYVLFPENQGQEPADPNEPTDSFFGSIPTTPDALDPDYESPEPGELPTQEGYYMVLNNTATNLLYSSYVGGLLDDVVFGPYVDSFGDSWVCGYTESFRRYVLTNSTGQPTIYETNASLPASLITPLAFKASGDAVGNFGQTLLFGALNPDFPFVNPLAFPPPDGQAPLPRPFVGATHRRDGFVFRQRVAFPSVDTVVATPNTVPGGLGAFTTMNMNLSAPAPAGGADIVVTLSNSAAASFANGTDQSVLEFTIPAGTQAASFPVFTKAVTTNTGVDVRVAYLGSFKVARVNVIPWLQQLGITPTEVVGGNVATGRVTLAAPAPAGGVTVDLLTDRPDITNFGVGISTVTIPAGNQTGTFTINTGGVVSDQFPRITASLLGVGKTQAVTVKPTTLANVTFAPSRIAGGSTTVGTVTLNGDAGAGFQVRLRANAGTPGYRFRADASSPQVGELILAVPSGARSATFLFDTVYESVNTQRIVTAQAVNAAGTPIGSPVTGTVFVDAVNLTGFTINPSSVDGGEDLIATINIGSPAPAGGVTVNLESGNPSVAPVPSPIIVPAGQSSASVTISTNVIFGRDQTIGFKAKRGGLVRNASATVRASKFSLSLSPTSVTGGTGTSTGTITLESAAPVGGLTFQVRSQNTAVATTPLTVTVPEGDASAAFPITTKAVLADTSVVIRASLADAQSEATLTVLTTRLLNFTLSTTQLRPFRSVLGLVELASPAPAGGVNVDLQMNTNLFALYPTNLRVFVPAGQTEGTFVIQAKAISVPTSTTIRASAGGVSRGILVNILR
jgi:hypothetical protein